VTVLIDYWCCASLHVLPIILHSLFSYTPDKSIAVLTVFLFLQTMSQPSANSFWSNACQKAESKPLQTLLDAAYASCGVTVRCHECLSPSAVQLMIFFFVVGLAFDALLSRLQRIA
jgi:hypothetical protein